MDRSHLILLLLVFAVSATGISGYMLIEGWSFSDALYMTAITLTTTGFQEVHSLSEDGRMFTTFLLIVGVGTVAYSATSVLSSLFTFNLMERGRKRMATKAKKLTDHTIVCGFGRMGNVICEELHAAKVNFIVVEKDPVLIGYLEKTNYLWIEGDAANDDTLKDVGIERAKFMVSTVDNDSDALYLALAARNLNPEIHIVVRANSEDAEKKILMAGADRVVLPFTVSGAKVAQSIINPEIEDILEIAGVSHSQEMRLQIVDLPIEKGSPLIGKNLRTCGVRRDGLIVVGIKNKQDGFQFAPDADQPFKEGDCLVALGTNESYEKVLKHL